MTVTKGNTNNTALSNLKLIRKLFYDAIREEIVQPDQNPFSKFKFKWDTPDVEYLTEEELERIETFVLSRRFSDRARPGFVCVRLLRRRNPYRRCVAFEMGQYREGTVIAYNGENQIGPEYSVTVQSASHLQRYKMPDNKPSDYVFPFIRTADTGIELRKEIERRTAYINRLLKNRRAGRNR